MRKHFGKRSLGSPRRRRRVLGNTPEFSPAAGWVFVFGSRRSESLRLWLSSVHQKNSKIFLDDKLRQFRTEFRRFEEFLLSLSTWNDSVLSETLQTDKALSFSCCSYLEHRVSVKRFVSLQFLNPKTIGRTPWKGDQPVARPLPTQTE
jgi:hypothetical protein